VVKILVEDGKLLSKILIWLLVLGRQKEVGPEKRRDLYVRFSNPQFSQTRLSHT
jgi:hypothetical protein